MPELEIIDPKAWAEAIEHLLRVYPGASTLLLVAAGVGVVRWAIVPLIRVLRRR